MACSEAMQLRHLQNRLFPSRQKNSAHGLEAKTHIRSILSFRLDMLIFLKKSVSSEAWTVQMTLNAFDDL
jgi:hypothetical protein